MKKPKRRAPLPLPLLWGELMLSSWETVARRTWLMAQGSCSVAEYSRMVNEKVLAATLSALALAKSRRQIPIAAALAPWHRRAAANAKRLRKR